MMVRLLTSQGLGSIQYDAHDFVDGAIPIEWLRRRVANRRRTYRSDFGEGGLRGHAARQSFRPKVYLNDEIVMNESQPHRLSQTVGPMVRLLTLPLIHNHYLESMNRP